jgi:two-component system chemotaxis sensor kinase CheA
MIRNALDHGLETPEVRRAQGKDPVGRITLSACHQAGTLVIALRDDGAGFNKSRIIDRALAHGHSSQGAFQDEDLFRLVLEPGFSTAEASSGLSGRGVGMDVVRRNIESLRGSVAIASEEGVGSTVTLRLPLTLAIIQGFFVAVAEEVYVIPVDAVSQCLELPREEVPHQDGCGVLYQGGVAIPYLRLRDLFALGGSAPPRESVVVVRHGERLAGIAVDVLLGDDQAVIKPLGRLFRDVPAVLGSTIAGNGRVALILDIPALLRLVEARMPTAKAPRKETA